MHSYRLVPEGASSKTAWLLEWDDERFVLRDVDGIAVLDSDTASAHHVIDLSQTFIDGTICFAIRSEGLRFKRNSTAEAALRKLVEAGLRRDPVYRAAMRQRALRAMTFGPVMFLVAGGLFGCYCWCVIGAPDPPVDSWIRYFGWLIKGILLVLLAVALLGLGLSCSGLCQWLRIRGVERQASMADIEHS